MFFGISYGEMFVLIGVTAAVVGPKELPKVARTLGLLTGRTLGYVRKIRSQLGNAMDQPEFQKMHKELQETRAQMEAITHDLRFSMHPSPFTSTIFNPPVPSPSSNGDSTHVERGEKQISTDFTEKDNIRPSSSVNMHTQATAYARLAESEAVKQGFKENENLDDKPGLFTVLPISAEIAGFIPARKDDIKGSDLVLEAMLEAEVARNAKDFFSKPENQLPPENQLH